MKLFALILTFGSLAIALSACNTTRGVGEDVSAAGDAVQRAAS